MIGSKVQDQIMKMMIFIKFILIIQETELIRELSDRTEDMIKNGAISEVKKFIRLKVPRS